MNNQKPPNLCFCHLSTLFAFTFFALRLIGADAPNPDAVQGAPITIVENQRTEPVDFEREILPVLKNNCMACHNQTKAKADLILETPQSILKGGESGPAVIPGKARESLLLRAASHQQKPHMPPKDNKVNATDLTPEQLGLVKLWIDQGATGQVQVATPMEWKPMPEKVTPIYAVALTPDGQFAACGRANQIFIYHLPSGQLITRLSDPQLSSAESSSSNSAPQSNSGIAHRDLVHSLAFSPDGNLLASGGYREVKLWQRPRDVQKLHLAFSASNAVQAIAASADGKWLATDRADGGLTLWDAATGKEAASIRGGEPAKSLITCLKFSPGSDRLCSLTADQTLRLWTIPDSKLLAETNLSQEIGQPEPKSTNALGSDLSVTWMADGKQLATGGADKIIRFWEVPDETNGTTKLLREIKGHEAAITCLEGVPRVSSAEKETSAKDGEAQNGTESKASTATLSNAAIFLLSGSADGLIRLWNIETGEKVHEVKHGEALVALAVRGDGRRFASAGLDGSGKLWNVEDGKLLAEMKGDRYADEFLAETERTATVAANEVSYRKNGLEAAEKQQKSGTERLTKAKEAAASAEKAFAEKQKQFQTATEARTGAEKTLADINTELKKVTEDYEAADKLAKQAAAEAKTAVEKATQAKLLADQATQTKSETERIAADAAGVASKSKAAAGTNLADSIKTAAEKMAADAAAVAEKAKAFAGSAAQDAIEKAKVASEARAAAEKAIDEVAAKSFALGQRKPHFDKVSSEGPERIKQAAEKLTASSNALVSVEKEFKKADQVKSTADQELQLANTATQQAADALAQAKVELQTSESRRKKAEAGVEQAKSTRAKAQKPIRALAFSPDGLVLATSGDDHKVHTWSAETGAPFETFPAPKNQSDGAAAALSPAGGNERTPRMPLTLAFNGANTLLCASPEGFTAWDLNPAWVLQRTVGTGGPDSPFVDRVNAIRFSPDGKWLATGGGEPSRSGEILIWNVAEGKVQKELRNVHSDTVLALDFSPNGNYLASGAADRFVKVVEMATGKVVKSFEGHLHHVLGVSWKSDGRTLASSGADNVVKVWDFVTGERKKNIDGFGKEVTSVAFIDATDQALASSGDNQVRLVRENGENVRTFSGATDYVYSAGATPDGKIVVAGGEDGVLRIWSGTDGKSLENFSGSQTK